MTYIITDWMNNVCFDSDSNPFETFEDGWNFIYHKMHEIHGFDFDEIELEEYFVEQYREGIDRLMWNGQRYVFKKDYYKVCA